MAQSIFLLHGKDELTPMAERQYDSEDRLQDWLAKYPDLLAGDQMDGATPRRWLLVRREMGVPGEEEGGGRWSVDHLFLDQDGVPTLVEVKRSSDTRLRREMVGQMLDYAANAVVYWPVEEIQDQYERRCEAQALDSGRHLIETLGSDIEPDRFWQQVKTNLQAGRVRMVFVADVIPPELRRIVEFLNEQMDPAEVLAVEIRQYVGGQGMRTLVPRVLGLTAESEKKKAGGSRQTRQWDETSFFDQLKQDCDQPAYEVIRKLFDWSRQRVDRIWWGKGGQTGSVFPIVDVPGSRGYLFSLWTYGKVEIPFGAMRKGPPFDSLEKRHELLNRYNKVPGISLGAEQLELWPRIEAKVLTNPAAMEAFLDVASWALDQIRHAAKSTKAPSA